MSGYQDQKRCFCCGRWIDPLEKCTCQTAPPKMPREPFTPPFKSKAPDADPRKPQPNAGVLTDSARAQAAAEEVVDWVNSEVCPTGGNEIRNAIAAIITKHMLRAKHTSGPGGVSLTDADKFLIADMRAIIEDGDSHGRAATHPTTIHLRQGLEQLILLITRLQGSPS